MSEPSTWALRHARSIYLYGECKCDHNGVCDLHTDIARELDAAREEGRREGYRAAVLANGSTPYALLDVLRILADAADHLHNDHNCDTHGWEVTAEARDAAREIIAEMTRVCGSDVAHEGRGDGGSRALTTASERDDLDQRNAAMLADLTDAVYGKGTAEAKGYPRGMAAKVRRVFGRLRRIKREESRRSQRFFIADIDALLKEVK